MKLVAIFDFFTLVINFNLNLIVDIQLFFPKFLPEDGDHSLIDMNDAKLFCFRLDNFRCIWYILVASKLNLFLFCIILQCVEVQIEFKNGLVAACVNALNWLNQVVGVVCHFTFALINFTHCTKAFSIQYQSARFSSFFTIGLLNWSC